MNELILLKLKEYIKGSINEQHSLNNQNC